MERNYGYGRNNSYLNRYASKKTKNKKGLKNIDKDMINRIANQFIVSAVISLLIVVLSNFSSPFVDKIIVGAKWIAGTDYDFKAAASSIKTKLIPEIDSKLKGISGTAGSLLGKGQAVDTSSGSTSDMIMPVDGQITSVFGTRVDPISNEGNEQHKGIDIAGEKGAPIKAALDGVVIKIGENNSIGRSVRVKHDNGLETLYGHCSEILVNENQMVKQGEYIAKVGDTGLVTAAHLHFEVIKDGKQVDPLSILQGVKELK